MAHVVPRLYDPFEVQQIMAGITRRIYVWGEVVYEDAFRIKRYVKFSQSLFWLANGSVMTEDTDRHNDAD
jgi:hypothetical protein